jgi:hypothetical protein
MKKRYVLIGICALIILISCEKPSKIQLRNDISKVKITEVYWGSVWLSNELLPGESSQQQTLYPQQENFPKKHKVTFKMTANNKIIYLETEDEYTLGKEDELLIVLSDNTKVSNPNK